MVITQPLLQTILEQYSLSWNGIHGLGHWARVAENGHALAEINGANLEIVELFAVLHDAGRRNDGFDKDHGRRSADFAASLRGSLIHLDDPDFELLYKACAYHTDGLTEADLSIQTCWDADRLDLGRAGILPQPHFLCTQAAKDPEMIQCATQRSMEEQLPILVHQEWGINPP
jgi:uncharacterized protein